MLTPSSEWLHALVLRLTSPNRFPAYSDEPEHREAMRELERHLEREIARRLGRRHRDSST
jgi:hypothetical protein